LKPITIIWNIVAVAALIPAAMLAWKFYQVFYGDDPNALTANPGDYITDQTGTWALAFLFFSLAITPLRRFTGWNAVIKLRKLLGLTSFLYATLHMLTWVVFINLFTISFMVEDVIKRRFITVGMATWVILLALALTSTTFAIRKMGRRWQTLHRFVYAAAILAVVHFWWLVKQDTTEPRRWAFALIGLLGVRVWWAYQKRHSRA
jgi:methionine sulfoxide reductase heme-binding subunit